MDAAAQTPAASLPSAPMSHIPCILDLAAGNADVLQCAVVDRLLAARIRRISRSRSILDHSSAAMASLGH
jgi:hypothetical protein